MLELVTEAVIVTAWVGGVMVVPLLASSVIGYVALGRLQRRLRRAPDGPAVAVRAWRVARLVLWRGWRPLLLALGWLQPVILIWLLIGGPMLPVDAGLNRTIEATPWLGSLPSGLAAFCSPFVWAVVWFVLAMMPRRLAATLPIAAVRQDWVLQCGRCGTPLDFDRELLTTCPTCGAANLDPGRLATDDVELPRSQAIAAIDQIQGPLVGFAFASAVMLLGIVLLLLATDIDW